MGHPAKKIVAEELLPSEATLDDDPVDERAVAAFGRWYEAQPAEWIAFMDELGRKGAAPPRR